MDKELKEGLKVVARAMRDYSKKHGNYVSIFSNNGDGAKGYINISGRFGNEKQDGFDGFSFDPVDREWYSFGIADKSIIDELNVEEKNRNQED